LPYGQIAKLNLIFDKHDKEKCRGFGFVTFESESSNEAILKEAISFQGRQLIIRKQLHGEELEAFQRGLK
jgi:RNA recognition motif-containing protein